MTKYTKESPKFDVYKPSIEHLLAQINEYISNIEPHIDCNLADECKEAWVQGIKDNVTEIWEQLP